MASHTKSELRWAAGVLARAVRSVATEPVPARRAPEPVRGGSRVFDALAEAA
jgi:hypothetical protein